MAANQVVEEEKAALELQERMLVAHQTLSRLAAQDRSANTRKRQVELMLTEMKDLPDTTVMYKSVGKAYLLTPKADLVAEAEATVVSVGSEIDNLKVQRGIVEQKYKETENELKELISSHPDVRRQLAGVRVA